MKTDNDTTLLMETYGAIMEKPINVEDLETIKSKVSNLSQLIHDMIITYRIDRKYTEGQLRHLHNIQSHLFDISAELSGRN